MVDTRRSSNNCASSSSTTPEASPSQRPSKRSKVKFDAASGSSLEPVDVEPTGSSSKNESPNENQESESGEPELGSSDPKAMDAEKPVTTDVTIKKKDSNAPWAMLLSHNPENPHRIIRDRMFTVGRQGGLQIRENSMPTNLCTLEQNEKLLSQACLKIVGNGVHINGYEFGKGITVHINGGDELTFGYSGYHSYVSFWLTDHQVHHHPNKDLFY